MPEPTAAHGSTAGGPDRPKPRRWGSRRVVVRDESMLPTLRPGDRLLVDPRAYRDRPPRVGEIVVFVDPEAPTRWLIKRVTRVDGAGAWVEVRGDAADTARDSRRFGPVPARSIVGRAYRCYLPVDRRRAL